MLSPRPPGLRHESSTFHTMLLNAFQLLNSTQKLRQFWSARVAGVKGDADRKSGGIRNPGGSRGERLLTAAQPPALAASSGGLRSRAHLHTPSSLTCCGWRSCSVWSRGRLESVVSCWFHSLLLRTQTQAKAEIPSFLTSCGSSRPTSSNKRAVV